jgi:DNA-binding Xre family transcriptional regulator
MDYNEIKFIAESKNMQICDLDDELGLARNGLKRSFERQTLSMSKVLQLCHILGITPNQLLGWPDAQNVSGNYASNISGGNTQNSNEAIKALKDQLKEKDKQIGRLLTILEKSGSQSAQSDGGSYHYVAADNPVEYPKGKGN